MDLIKNKIKINKTKNVGRILKLLRWQLMKMSPIV